MTDKILIVTQPDDSLLQGIRVTHINLNEEQSNIISVALLQTEITDNIINYVWKTGESLEWLLDKIYKSDLIIFNADSNDRSQSIIGWTAAQSNSYYFGTLKDLHLVNDRILYNSTDVLNLVEKFSSKTVVKNNLNF